MNSMHNRFTHSQAFIKGIGGVLALSAPLSVYHFSTAFIPGDIGVYWQHVGEYIESAMDVVEPDVVSAEHQLSLKLDV